MNNEEDQERAEAYLLVGNLFMAPPSGDVLGLVADIAGDDTPLGQAAADLGQAARTLAPEEIDDEFVSLFVGLQPRDDVAPYASIHLGDMMYGPSLGKLRQDLQAMGIERREGVDEPEDHVSALCETMAGLLRGSLGRDVTDAQVSALYKEHLASWIPSFAQAIERTEGVVFYGALARFLRLFLERENARFV